MLFRSPRFLGEFRGLDILGERAKRGMEEQDQIFSGLTGPGGELRVFLRSDGKLAAEQCGAVTESDRMLDVVANATFIEALEVGAEAGDSDCRAANQVFTRPGTGIRFFVEGHDDFLQAMEGLLRDRDNTGELVDTDALLFGALIKHFGHDDILQGRSDRFVENNVAFVLTWMDTTANQIGQRY